MTELRDLVGLGASGPTPKCDTCHEHICVCPSPLPDVVKTEAEVRERCGQLEQALVNLIDAVDAKNAKRIDAAMFVGRGLTF